MKPSHSWLVIGICVFGALFSDGCATGSGKGGGTATVTFVNPERFTDFKAGGRFGEQQRKEMLADLENFIVAEVKRVLPADRSLDLRILDINEAGIVMHTAGSARVGSDLSPARVDLEYVLREGGKEIASGSEFVTGDSTRLESTARFGGSQPAVKEALRRWIQRMAKK